MDLHCIILNLSYKSKIIFQDKKKKTPQSL